MPIRTTTQEGAPQTRGLRSLDAVRPLYMLPTEPLTEEVLIPGFKGADGVDCMAGFFSSGALASLAPGLATYIADSENSLRFIISPALRVDDKAAMEEGLKSAAEVAETLFGEIIVTEDLIQQHTLKCLSWLLRAKRMEIKVAFMKDALFHPKVWLFKNRADMVAVHGSSNITYAGIALNIEQVAVSHSWRDSSQKHITDKFGSVFNRLWENDDDNCHVIDMPEAIKRRLIATYGHEAPPTEAQLKSLYERATEVREEPAIYEPTDPQTPTFSIPRHLRYEDGPFKHQGDAVNAWRDAGHRGVLEMATGSGKTITAMICACKLREIRKPLLIVVAAPHVPLIEQWRDEIAEFGLKPVNLTTAGNAAKRAGALQTLKRRIRMGLSDVEAVVVSHDTLCTPAFAESVSGIDCDRLLIADEAHNLGRASFIKNPPEYFQHRLGLSATPIRQYDEEGTEALFGFFGPVVFRFPLEEAIGRCLVEYDYYLHPVYLVEDEMDEWYDLTDGIKRQIAQMGEDGGAEAYKPDDYLLKLLRDRRVLLETASGKVSALKSLLNKEDTRDLRHTLIYTSDKGPRQIEAVNRLLHESNILFHQLTSAETSDRGQVKRIVKSFQNAEIQVLTAKRVLDEGVNIPQIRRAFILASTTVERQWVQRRGRLLRACGAIGKEFSIIHDFLALPPDVGYGQRLDSDARRLVHSELTKAREFARLARNAGRDDGPLPILDKLANAAYLAGGV